MKPPPSPRRRVHRHPAAWYALSAALSVAGVAIAACSAGGGAADAGDLGAGGGGAGNGGGARPTSSASGGTGGGIALDAGGCVDHCSADLRTAIDCDGNMTTCGPTEVCDTTAGACADACSVAVATQQSVGCEYYATYMDTYEAGVCFAVFVANTWSAPAHLGVSRAGATIPIGNFAYVPSGAPPNLMLQPYDDVMGLPPGEVAILFLAGSPGASLAPCPVPAAVTNGALLFHKSGIGASFHITTDVPVVAYQMNPYGGGSAAVTGASLLLPTSAWDTNYVAVSPADAQNGNPSMNIVASEDQTTVTMVPVNAVIGGGGVPAAAANTTMTFTLNRGEHAQISQPAALTGSVIQSDKPVGLMAGHQCMNVPIGVDYCDHAEQMIPPVRALGSEYVAVQHRPRRTEPGIWRVVGAVDGTQLTYSSDVGGPATLESGTAMQFVTAEPFVVTSQDADHPFMLFAYMSGSAWQPNLLDYGDPDFVLGVPPQQYLKKYVFFTDPTYPEANLVLVRSKVDGAFSDVTLDCAGVVGGWTPIGDYEWTRVDLVTGNFQKVGACSAGRHQIESDAPFGLWVWGWGTPLTSSFTANVSYGYPGGMNVTPINDVVIPPNPK